MPNDRKWYEKIRFILPTFLLPIFFSIYYFWDHYPEYLIKNDTKTEISNSQQEKIINWPLSTSIIYSTSQYAEEEPKTNFQEIGEKYGTYGDTYGSLNTLFTGLAFAGLIISIFIQLLELRQTRKELAEQSKAMVDQKTEFSAQTKILEKQADINANQQKIIDAQFKETQKTNFLNHFFKLIDQRNLLLNELILPTEDGLIKGHNVLIEFSKEFTRINEYFNPEEDNEDYYYESWKNFVYESYGNHNYQLISYFKMYRIICYTIHSSKLISDAEKKYYFETLRTVMSVEEQLVLMWCSIFIPQLQNFCNKHSLLMGLYSEHLEKIGVIFFERNAFKNKYWNKAFDKYEGSK